MRTTRSISGPPGLISHRDGPATPALSSVVEIKNVRIALRRWRDSHLAPQKSGANVGLPHTEPTCEPGTKCHVWTTPSKQGRFGMCAAVGCGHVSGLCCAALGPLALMQSAARWVPQPTLAEQRTFHSADGRTTHPLSPPESPLVHRFRDEKFECRNEGRNGLAARDRLGCHRKESSTGLRSGPPERAHHAERPAPPSLRLN